MAATPALRNALNQGISSGNLVDTKIILFSRRKSSGGVCRPKALYANSNVLNTVPYFINRESITVPDFTHVESHSVGPEVLFGRFSESQLKDFNEEEIDDEGSAEDYGYLSDSDLEDDEDEKTASFKRSSKPRFHPFDPFGANGEDKRTFCEEYEERVEKGKVLKIPDVAFVT